MWLCDFLKSLFSRSSQASVFQISMAGTDISKSLSKHKGDKF
mgnify:CR=1 FL=1